MKFAVVTFPCSMDTDAGTAAGPKALMQAGLADWLREQGNDVAGPFHVQLPPDEEAAYGAWNQIGLAKPKRRPETMRHWPCHAHDDTIRKVERCVTDS
jgi:hypothetical protein